MSEPPGHDVPRRSRDAIWTDAGAAPGGAYSQAVRAGDFVFVSGQGPFDAAGNIVGEEVVEQLEQSLANVGAILAAIDLSLADVVKVGVFLDNWNLFEEFDRAYASHFTEPYPARTTVAADLGGILIEIDVIARAPLAS